MRYPHILLGVSLALWGSAAWADHRDYDDHQDSTVILEHHQRYPTVSQVAEVQGLAHELDDAARHTYRAAYETRQHFTWREDRALRKLDRLADWARHFHAQVETYRQDPTHTDADFQNLVRAYVRARDGVRTQLHATAHVRDDFKRVEAIMDRLIDYYGGPDYYSRNYMGYFVERP